MLRELHTTTCLQCFQVNLQGKLVKLSFCPFCTYVGGGGNDLPYLNHIIIVHYNASYGCGKCLKQAFISSSALHNHKKVCLRLTSQKSAGVSDGKPSISGGDSSCGGSSKATPKKDGKAPAADSKSWSTPPASQPSPCRSRWETSHHHKSHKKDSGGMKKKAKDASLARRSSSHKARH